MQFASGRCGEQGSVEGLDLVHRPHGPSRALDQVVEGCGDRACDRLEPLAQLVEDALQEVVASREDAVRRAHRHVGALGDVGDRHLAGIGLLEQVNGGVEDATAGGCRLLCPQAQQGHRRDRHPRGFRRSVSSDPTSMGASSTVTVASAFRPQSTTATTVATPTTRDAVPTVEEGFTSRVELAVRPSSSHRYSRTDEDDGGWNP